jgi:hypothetical protein
MGNVFSLQEMLSFIAADFQSAPTLLQQRNGQFGMIRREFTRSKSLTMTFADDALPPFS